MTLSLSLPKQLTRKAAAIAMMALTAVAASASDEATRPVRPVTSVYTVEAGGANICDTYLTPLHYDGWHAALGYTRRQAMGFSPEAWVRQLDMSLSFNSVQNPARNADMYDLSLSASWAMMRRWRLPVDGLSAGIGGYTGINLGALYLARNGNNPVSAKADWTIGPAGYCAYATHLRHLPLTLRYSASMPLTGIFFSPDYGELYYEIYLGNHRGLVHPAWWGNFFRYDHRLTVDMHFGATTLTVGYHGDIFSSKVNHIVTRRFTHALVLGITSEWISLSHGTSRSPLSNAEIISANY